MILVLAKSAQSSDVDALMTRLEWMGLRAVRQDRDGSPCLAVVAGVDDSVKPEDFSNLPMVEKVVPFSRPFKLAGRNEREQRLVIDLGSVQLGGDSVVVMAGPCSVESEEQIHQTAKIVANAGATVLRGGAFKPRTSPYSFQGLGKQGLIFLREAAQAHGMKTISEIMDLESLDDMLEEVDILQVGARNMQNFSLLKHLGKVEKPIFLKRGLSATYKDLLMSAEYVLNGGNEQVILCERGIRTFETHSRNTLDIAAVPILHQLSHLPVIVDPSHGTGLREMVSPAARAAVAAGADGLMVEVHPNPDEALSDGPQSLNGPQFEALMDSLRRIVPVVDRTLPAPVIPATV